LISDQLPPYLQVQITLQLNKRMVESVKIFAGCPRAFIQSLVFKLVPSICVLGDNIVTEGEFGDCLYFIRRGIAEVVVKGNIVVCKLHEGDYFGEIALIRNEKRTADVRAVTDCMLLSLCSADLDLVLESFPYIRARIEASATDRLAQLKRADSVADTNKQKEKMQKKSKRLQLKLGKGTESVAVAIGRQISRRCSSAGCENAQVSRRCSIGRSLFRAGGGSNTSGGDSNPGSRRASWSSGSCGFARRLSRTPPGGSGARQASSERGTADSVMAFGDLSQCPGDDYPEQAGDACTVPFNSVHGDRASEEEDFETRLPVRPSIIHEVDEDDRGGTGPASPREAIPEEDSEDQPPRPAPMTKRKSSSRAAGRRSSRRDPEDDELPHVSLEGGLRLSMDGSMNAHREMKREELPGAHLCVMHGQKRNSKSEADIPSFGADDGSCMGLAAVRRISAQREEKQRRTSGDLNDVSEKTNSAEGAEGPSHAAESEDASDGGGVVDNKVVPSEPRDVAPLADAPGVETAHEQGEGSGKPADAPSTSNQWHHSRYGKGSRVAPEPQQAVAEGTQDSATLRQSSSRTGLRNRVNATETCPTSSTERDASPHSNSPGASFTRGRRRNSTTGSNGCGDPDRKSADENELVMKVNAALIQGAEGGPCAGVGRRGSMSMSAAAGMRAAGAAAVAVGRMVQRRGSVQNQPDEPAQADGKRVIKRRGSCPEENSACGAGGRRCSATGLFSSVSNAAVNAVCSRIGPQQNNPQLDARLDLVDSSIRDLMQEVQRLADEFEMQRQDREERERTREADRRLQNAIATKLDRLGSVLARQNQMHRGWGTVATGSEDGAGGHGWA